MRHIKRQGKTTKTKETKQEPELDSDMTKTLELSDSGLK